MAQRLTRRQRSGTNTRRRGDAAPADARTIQAHFASLIEARAEQKAGHFGSAMLCTGILSSIGIANVQLKLESAWSEVGRKWLAVDGSRGSEADVPTAVSSQLYS